ncbi:MAG: hypothetical protein AAGE59_17290 [Cyanobacteria bacterium P01_F01_bin.86]
MALFSEGRDAGATLLTVEKQGWVCGWVPWVVSKRVGRSNGRWGFDPRLARRS